MKILCAVLFLMVFILVSCDGGTKKDADKDVMTDVEMRDNDSLVTDHEEVTNHDSPVTDNTEEQDDSEKPAQGEEGGDCYPNGTCNEGLECVDGTCEYEYGCNDEGDFPDESEDSDVVPDEEPEDEFIPEEYTVDGFVQKGPFVQDSSVKITELDHNFEKIPATSFTTQTIDDLGNFNIKRTFSSRYILLEATGFYYNEVAGSVSSTQITNYVFVDLEANNTKISINILTTLARKRIQYLMKNGKNFNEARSQSETEILEIFGIFGEPAANFQDMDMLKAGNSNAMLLAISARLQGDNTPGELSNLIAGIIYDIEKDGTLDQLSLKNKLSDGGKYIGSKLIAIRNNLETHFGEITTVNIADFEQYCDDDGDGVINKWDFVIALNPVDNAQFSTTYTSNSIEIIIPYGANDATAKVTNGTLVVNGIDTGVLTDAVSSGDTVAIKLTTGDTYNVSVSGILSVTYTAIGAGSQENKGTFVVTTSCESGVSRTIDCEGGTQNQICNDGIWSNVGNCEPKNCTTEGSFRQISCGNNGKQTQKCVSSLWVNEGICVEKLADPVFVLPAGTYQTAQNVEITHPESGVVIKYTVNDPLDPSEGYGLVYTAPINIPTDETVETVRTIKAKAYKSGFEVSNMVTREYTVTGTVATPQFNLSSGTYNTEKAVSITTATPGATIKYTLDGTTPNETNGMVYTGAINITESKTLKAFAYKTNWVNSNVVSASYTLKPATPTFNPPSGTYSTDQNVVISTSITDGVIIYTLDGSEPSEINGTTYTAPVNLTANTTDETFPVIKAKVFKPGWSDSDTGTANYNMTGKVEAPTMNPVPGTYSSQQSIVLSTVTSGTTIRYTTDKTEPTSGSTLYTVPIVIPSNQINETLREIRAKAFRTDWIDSETTTGNYTVTGTVVIPQFSLVAGTYNTDQTVTITTTTSDASIRYTTDGTDPSDTVGNIYTSPVDITATTTLKAVAYKTDWTNSSVQSSDYTMKMADPVFSVLSGTYTTTQNITLSTLSPHSEIRYTTNGDDPDKTSTLYTGAIELPTNEIDETITTIKAKTFSIEFGWEDSGITENTYRITGTVATPVLSPDGGTYTTSQSVTITCVTNGATIRYTINGTEPTTGSSVFTAPISLENGSITTVKTKAFRIDWVNSATGSSTYKIDNIPAPVITPDGGVFNEPVQNVMITTPINGATIRYVLDGGEPVDSSAIYSGPITFDVSRHLVAKVFKPGFTTSPKAEKGYVVGRERTTKLLGSPLNDEGHSIFVDSSGNTYITGYAGGSLDGNTYAGNSDIFLAKWNNHLEKQWVQQWGTSFSDYGTSIVADSSGNIYVTGETQSSLDGNIWNVGYSSIGIPYTDVFLTKWNNSGEKQWTKQWGTNKKDTGRSVAIDASGNIYVTGITWGSLDGNANKGEDDVFITKWNSNGEKQWTKQWGTSNWDESNSINIDTSGNIFITGYTDGRWDGANTVDSDIFLTKLNDAGESLWTEQVKISYYNKANSVAVDSTGNIYVLGVYKSKLDTGTDMDVFLVKWNSSGEILWIKNWGNIYYEVGNSLTIDHDDNIYIMSNGLIKLNSDGKILWTKQWGVIGTGVGTDFYGDVYVTGWMSGSIDNNTSAGYNDIFISKWSFDDYSSDLGCQLLPTPSPDTYNTPQNVSLSCSTEGSDIRFEINDPEPDMFSIPYENPIEVTETSTLKAIAYKLGVAGYSKTSPVYTIDEGLEQVAAPTFDQPNEGDNRKVIIYITIATETPGAIIKYTLDGSEPSRTNGYEYTEPVSTSVHDVLRAKAFKSGMTDSITVTADYHILYTVCTGQTLCYNDSTNMDCPGIGETFYGQDTQYGDMRYCASKSFDILGTEPEEIVTDNNTGLIWQRTFSINSNSWKSAVSYCNGLVYAGKADWRLPTRKELATLIDYGRYNPSVDTFTFPSIKSNNYWSSSFFVHDTDDAWIVDSGKGSVVNIHKNNGGQVICVRGIDWTPVGIFEELAISGEVIVKDTATGLIWQKEYSGVLTWVNALSYCENSNYAGYADWRLPNIEELKTLIDDSIIIPGAPSTDFWSSSSYVGDIRFAWNMNLPEGQVDISVKTGQSYARCVR
jgi:hypothetical protein